MRSIQSLTVAIEGEANREQKKRPRIVVGGHAPTIVDPAAVRRALGVVDYIVVGAGEEALLLIAESDLGRDIKASPQTCEIIHVSELTSDPKKPANKTTLNRAYAAAWPRLPWLERDHFKRRLGKAPYEPAQTRNHRHREAHVVMTRGCNWTCSFCTEALVGSGYGEMRRPASDVVSEVQRLVKNASADRIQFVDDNVLPSNPMRQRDGRDWTPLTWSQDFLEGLARVKGEKPRFSWRGLMRLEDFRYYQSHIPNFIPQLSRSGCNLLAFGIESGVQAKRDKLKAATGNTLTNEEISELFATLAANEIHTKGYFILGGPEQTRDDIDETISFAKTSGLSLAYFAIYKDFRALSTAQDLGDKLAFSVFAQKLDECLVQTEATSWEDAFGAYMPYSEAKVVRRVYSRLKAAGFAFGDLIKYNDFHTDEQFYVRLGFADSEDYLRLLATAYASFYCRPQWPDTYKRLLKAGY